MEIKKYSVETVARVVGRTESQIHGFFSGGRGKKRGENTSEGITLAQILRFISSDTYSRKEANVNSDDVEELKRILSETGYLD